MWVTVLGHRLFISSEVIGTYKRGGFIDCLYLAKMLALTRKVGLSLMEWSGMEYLDGQ